LWYLLMSVVWGALGVVVWRRVVDGNAWTHFSHTWALSKQGKSAGGWWWFPIWALVFFGAAITFFVLAVLNAWQAWTA